MTNEKIVDLLISIISLLSIIADNNNENEKEKSNVNEDNLKENQNANDKVRMLTIKECLQRVDGVSETNLRIIITEDRIYHIRVGRGKNGKILVNEESLISYFKGRRD